MLSFCWVHVRRDFITVAHERDDQEEWAEQWLADIAALYHLNDERLEVRDEPAQYAAADAALRAGVQAMQERRERELAQQPKLPEACAKVLRSLRNHWQGLTLFVENPDLPMDNNQAERALRGPVVGRKNYYGSGAQWSGELSADAVQSVPHAGTVADQPAHLADRVSARLCGRRRSGACGLRAVPALEPARGARAARLARQGGRQPCRLRRCATADGCSASRNCS